MFMQRNIQKCNQPAKYEGDGGEMRAIVDKKFEEFNCSNILQTEAPNRTPYTCG